MSGMTWAMDLLAEADRLFPRAPGAACALHLDDQGRLCLWVPIRAGYQSFLLNATDGEQPGAGVAQAAFTLLAEGRTPWTGGPTG